VRDRQGERWPSDQPGRPNTARTHPAHTGRSSGLGPFSLAFPTNPLQVRQWPPSENAAPIYRDLSRCLQAKSLQTPIATVGAAHHGGASAGEFQASLCSFMFDAYAPNGPTPGHPTSLFRPPAIDHRRGRHTYVYFPPPYSPLHAFASETHGSGPLKLNSPSAGFGALREARASPKLNRTGPSTYRSCRRRRLCLYRHHCLHRSHRLDHRRRAGG